MTFGPDSLRISSDAYGRFLPRALDLTERTLVVLCFIFFLAANIAAFRPLNMVVAATESVAVFCILLRRPTDSVSLSPLDWALAIIGTVGPMFARPGGDPVTQGVLPSVLWIAGLFISVAAKFSLNRRFGVAPANRGVQARGAYAFIRHPMYAGYLLMNGAYLLLNPTTFNGVVYAIAWACQLGRIHREESWLRRDPAYLEYIKTVRFRVLPGII
jgi:protein-S-isoprenylcysteine O-methyltransferase Ste14